MPSVAKVMVAIEMRLDLLFCFLENFINISIGIVKGLECCLLDGPPKKGRAGHRWNWKLIRAFRKFNEGSKQRIFV